MRDFIDYHASDPDTIKDITHLYELRHNINVFGIEEVAKILCVDEDVLAKLYDSDIHGSFIVNTSLHCSKETIDDEINYLEEESAKEYEKIQNSRNNKYDLIDQLDDKRSTFCSIGTNKIKRRLNKLAKTDVIAKTTRLLLETEDCNILAKKCYGIYQEKIYRKKSKLILQLIDIFKENKWIYGRNNSEVPGATDIVYFELPNCEQISFHDNLPEFYFYPEYEKEWDGKVNSTLLKLEKFINEYKMI